MGFKIKILKKEKLKKGKIKHLSCKEHFPWSAPIYHKMQHAGWKSCVLCCLVHSESFFSSCWDCSKSDTLSEFKPPKSSGRHCLCGDSFLWHFSSAPFCCWSVGVRGWAGGWPLGNASGDTEPVLRVLNAWKLCTHHPQFAPATCPVVFLAHCSGMLSIKDSVSPRGKK